MLAILENLVRQMHDSVARDGGWTAIKVSDAPAQLSGALYVTAQLSTSRLDQEVYGEGWPPPSLDVTALSHGICYTVFCHNAKPAQQKRG